jgi:hypothetical protein
MKLFTKKEPESKTIESKNNYQKILKTISQTRTS